MEKYYSALFCLNIFDLMLQNRKLTRFNKKVSLAHNERMKKR